MGKLLASLAFCTLLTSIALGSGSPDRFYEPSERNLIYGMDHGAALLMDVYQPEDSNGLGLLFIMGTGFTAYGEYHDTPLKELDRWLLETGIFDDFYGGKGQLFGPALEAGFTVFSINYRLGPKNVFETQLADCQRAVQYIRYHAERFQVDPTRLSGLGHSTGASMIVLLSAAPDAMDPEAYDPIERQSSRLQAAIVGAGPFDLLSTFEEHPGEAGMLLSFTGKAITWQPEGHPVFDRYREASPLNYISEDDAPIFMIHGSDDSSVSLSQSLALQGRLEEVGLPNELLILEGAGHISYPGVEGPLPVAVGVEWLESQLSEK